MRHFYQMLTDFQNSFTFHAVSILVVNLKAAWQLLLSLILIVRINYGKCFSSEKNFWPKMQNLGQVTTQ